MYCTAHYYYYIIVVAIIIVVEFSYGPDVPVSLARPAHAQVFIERDTSNSSLLRRLLYGVRRTSTEPFERLRYCHLRAPFVFRAYCS